MELIVTPAFALSIHEFHCFCKNLAPRQRAAPPQCAIDLALASEDTMFTRNRLILESPSKKAFSPDFSKTHHTPKHASNHLNSLPRPLKAVIHGTIRLVKHLKYLREPLMKLDW